MMQTPPPYLHVSAKVLTVFFCTDLGLQALTLS